MEIESESTGVDRIDELAQAIMTAIVSGEEGERDSTLKIFLAKLYKNNTAPKPKRMNSIRISRFNAYLFKVLTEDPFEITATAIAYHSLLAVLLNDRNFQEDEDDEAVHSICHWSARLCLHIAKLGDQTMSQNLLEYLLNGTKPQLISLQQFQDLMRDSEYFRSNQLTSNNERDSLVEVTDYNICGCFCMRELIRGKMDIVPLYSTIFRRSASQDKVLQLFLKHMRIERHENKLQMFLDSFLSAPLNTIHQLELILTTLEDQMFDSHSLNITLQHILDKNTKIELLCNVNVKDLKVEEAYTQAVLACISRRPIDDLIQAFLGPKQPVNFFLFYVITSQTVPTKYVSLIFDDVPFTYRRALVFAMAVTQTPKAHKQLISRFTQVVDNCSLGQRSLILKSIHFSAQAATRLAVFASVNRHVQINNIDKECKLQFLPLLPLRNDRLDTEDKKNLSNLLKRTCENDEENFRIKIDLYAACGHEMPLLGTIRSLNCIFEQSVQEILRTLPSQKEEHLQAILMGLNNRLQVHYVQEINTNTLEWACKEYANFRKEYFLLLRRYLQANNWGHIHELCAAVAQFNAETKGDLIVEKCFGGLLSGNGFHRLKNSNFSDYFIAESAIPNDVLRLYRSKGISIELRKLIRNLTMPGDKIGNRKDIKNIVSTEHGSAYGFKALHFCLRALTKNPSYQALLKTLFQHLRSDYEFFDLVEKQAHQVSQQFYDPVQMVPDLLRYAYPETLAFVAKLLDSKEPTDKKKGRKKGKSKDKEEGELVLVVLSDNIGRLFGDPTQLQTYDPLFKILGRLPDSKQQISRQMNEWLKGMRIFHGDCFQTWRSKVVSFCEMWSKIIVDLELEVELNELERHSRILTDLLNSLYEKYRNETGVDQVEERLLTSLLLLHQHSLGEEMEIERNIPQEQWKNILQGYKAPFIGEDNFYQCFSCSHMICFTCASFVHRHHDKIYVGKEGSCIHDSAKKEEGAIRPRKANEESRHYGESWGTIQNQSEHDQYKLILQEKEIMERSRPMLRYENPFDSLRDISSHPYTYGAYDARNEHGYQYYREVKGREGIRQGQRDGNREGNREGNRGKIREGNREVIWEGYREGNREGYRREELRDARRERKKEDVQEQKDTRLEKEPRLQLGDQNKPEQEDGECRSEVAFRNVNQFQKAQCFFEPQFNPQVSSKQRVLARIKMAPLAQLLIRQFQTEATCYLQEKKQCSGPPSTVVTVQVLKEKYIFFKSNLLSSALKKQMSYGNRPMAMTVSSTPKRNLLSANKKLLVTYSLGVGLVSFNLVQMLKNFHSRENAKTYLEAEQEKNFQCGNNPSQLKFEPLEIVFSRANNSNLLAVVGLSSIVFFPIGQDGKMQSMIDSEFNRQAITKFTWLSKSKNTFAFSCGSTIRIGGVNDAGNGLRSSKFTISIEKDIRDFDLRNDSGTYVAYVIDIEGNLYRSQCSSRTNRAFNIAHSKFYTATKLDQAYSMFFFDNKLFVSLANGSLMVYKLNHHSKHPTLLEIIALEPILSQQEYSFSTLKAPFYLSNVRVFSENDHYTVACILKRIQPDARGKKNSGNFCIFKFAGNALEVNYLRDDESTCSYENTMISGGSCVFMGVEDSGTLWAHRHNINSASRVTEIFKSPMTDNVITNTNRILKANNLLAQAKHYEENRCLDFKEHKDLTNSFTITLVPELIRITANNPNKCFILGISFSVQPVEKGVFNVGCLGQESSFWLEQNRDIHIAFNLKETLWIFVDQPELIIRHSQGRLVKNVKIYGADFNLESPYSKAYQSIVNQICLYKEFPKEDLECYLSNSHRFSLKHIRLSDYAKLKEGKGYSQKQLNLLLKMELLCQSLPEVQGKLTSKELADLLWQTQFYLLPQCEDRFYLKNCCQKMMRSITELLLEGARVGHLFEYHTCLDFYQFERKYASFKQRKSLHTYQALLKMLYGLIYKRVANVYIILLTHPCLIPELAIYFKTVLNDYKHKIKGDDNFSQSSVKARVVSCCTALVGLFIEHYQLLKNTSQQRTTPEHQILELMESVFCPFKAEYFLSIFIHPFLTFQRLCLHPRKSIFMNCAVQFLRIASQAAEVNMMVEQGPDLGLSDDDEEKGGDDENDEKVDLMAGQEELIPARVSEDNILGPQESLKQMVNLITPHLLGENEGVQFIYYQFCFQLATSFFSLEMNVGNANFFLGFFFNILRIIEFRLDPERDEAYLRAFFDAVDSKLHDKRYSTLFLILNIFLEPERQGDRIVPSKTNLSREITLYYRQKKDLLIRFTSFRPTETAPPAKISDVLLSFPLNVYNQIYVLKFLGNLCLSLSLKDEPQIKHFVLSAVVKYNLRVFRSIMRQENWSAELDGVQVEVGFEKMEDDLEASIKLLHDCAKQTPLVLIDKLANDSEKVSRLENCLGKGGHEVEILNILNTYYSAAQ